MKFRPEAEPRRQARFKISWKFQPKKKISAVIAYKQTTDKKATDRSPSTVDGYLVMATKRDNQKTSVNNFANVRRSDDYCH